MMGNCHIFRDDPQRDEPHQDRERIRESPPSTPITWPVTQLCSGSSNHSIAEAISFASPIRPSACMPAEALAIISFCSSLAVSGVRVIPGATQLTRIPFEAYDAAAASARPSMPALAAEMASWLANPMRTAAVESSTMEPPCCAIAAVAARTTAKADFRLVVIVASHSSSESRCAGLRRRDPTQFATPVTPPYNLDACFIHDSTCRRLVASTGNVCAPSSAARLARRAPSRPASSRLAPLLARRLQSAEPTPPYAPKTTYDSLMTAFQTV